MVPEIQGSLEVRGNPKVLVDRHYRLVRMDQAVRQDLHFQDLQDFQMVLDFRSDPENRQHRFLREFRVDPEDPPCLAFPAFQVFRNYQALQVNRPRLMIQKVR